MLGKTLYDLRIKKGLTQSQLSQLIGLSPKMISFYEHDERVPSREALVKLADVFSVGVDFLLGREESPDPVGGSDNLRSVYHTIERNAEIIDGLSPGEIEEFKRQMEFMIKYAQDKRNSGKGK